SMAIRFEFKCSSPEPPGPHIGSCAKCHREQWAAGLTDRDSSRLQETCPDVSMGFCKGSTAQRGLFSSHGEPLLVQQVAVRAPDFQPPVTLVHGLPTVG